LRGAGRARTAFERRSGWRLRRIPKPAIVDLPRRRRVEQQTDVLVALAKDPALHAGDFEGAMRRLMEADARALRVERVSLWWFAEDRSTIQSLDEFASSTGRHAQGSTLDARDYPSYFTALEEARTIAARDARRDPRTREYAGSYLAPHGISSMLDVPVRLSGRIVAIVCHEHVGPLRAWTDDEQAFAGSIADLVALALEAQRRKEAQDALRGTLALLTATLEACMDGILVTDMRARIVRYNQRLLDILQTREEALLDGGVMALVLAKTIDPEGYARRIHELYARPEAASCDVLELECGRSVECDSRPQRLDGAIVGRVFWFRDVTLRRLAEAERDAVLARERRGRETAELLTEATAVLAQSLEYELNLQRLARTCVPRLADWCYVAVTEGEQPRMIAAAHWDPIRDLRLSHLLDGRPIGPVDPTSQVFRTGRPVLLPEIAGGVLRVAAEHDEYARLAVDFGVQSILAVPAIARDRVVAALTFCSAAPERRYSEEDLGVAEELARRVASAIDVGSLHRKTEEAVRMRSEFLALASHELRTPVTSLKLALEALRRASPIGDPAQSRRLSRLLDIPERQVQRLAHLIDSMLDVSRIGADKLVLHLETVDLLALAREVVTRSEHDAARAGCVITTRGAPVTGRWDRSRLDQVLTNLLLNALRYGARKPIEIIVGEHDGSATVEVIDHGIGIDPGRVPHIFDRFERAASHDHYPGLGLGLFISRAIAEAHGGRIECRSRPAAGSTFTITLPRAGPEIEAEARSGSAAEGRAARE
jgi:signal transduction histidine kinase/PAS domain-containing protein